jgi:hypothetical protein
MADYTKLWDDALARALAMPQDEAMFLAKGLPKQIVPKLPSYKDKVVMPPLTGALKYMTEEKAMQTLKDVIKNKKRDLEYMNPIPYDALVNEAVNRLLSR